MSRRPLTSEEFNARGCLALAVAFGGILAFCAIVGAGLAVVRLLWELAGSCIACAREVEPDRVTLLEALLSNATPENAWSSGPRQPVPAAVSLERARLWMRGESAP